MAYSNGFPIGYQQQYYPQYYYQYQQPQTVQQPTVQNQPQVNNGMIWVQGIGGAKSYLVGPNATVTLWDSEAPVIYLKSADASGMPSMKILDYTIRDTPQTSTPAVSSEDTFATKEDVNNIRGELEQFKARIDALTNRRDNRKEYSKNE